MKPGEDSKRSTPSTIGDDIDGFPNARRPGQKSHHTNSDDPEPEETPNVENVWKFRFMGWVIWALFPALAALLLETQNINGFIGIIFGIPVGYVLILAFVSKFKRHRTIRLLFAGWVRGLQPPDDSY